MNGARAEMTTLDEIIRILAEIEDQTEFDRLWKMLGELVYGMAKQIAARRDKPVDAGTEGA